MLWRKVNRKLPNSVYNKMHKKCEGQYAILYKVGIFTSAKDTYTKV